MKEDYFSQLDDYDGSLGEQQYTNGSCLFVCLFKLKSFDQFNLPKSPQILDIRNLKQQDAVKRTLRRSY